MGNIHTAGPNDVLVISGGCCSSRSVRTIIGGWGWAWWCVTKTQHLTLEVMTLNPKCENVETLEGVPLTVTGVAQVKVMAEAELLQAACEQFLGKSRREIMHTVLQTMEGHLRAILGTLSVESIYKDRDQFAQLVREVASPDVGRMGIEILSFTIKDLYDRVEYLNSLGRAQTALVKRDADIGVAEAERDAGIQESQNDKQRMEVRYQADVDIANARRGFELQKASFDVEINKAKAQAELAYQLQAAIVNQSIRAEEIEITVVERKKLIEIEEREILRNEKQLEATIKRPAEAEAFKIEITAEGQRIQRVLMAQADSESIRLRGQADAESIWAVGNAEATKMRLKANAYKKFGDAALLSMVLETLPKMAAEVCAPLSKTDEIVMLGDDRTSAELTKLLGTLPPAVQALTGYDISKSLSKIPGVQETTRA